MLRNHQYAVLRQVHSLLQREFSTRCHLAPPLSITSILFLRLSSSCLRLLPRPPFTIFLPSIFYSITCFRRQFLHKMWPINLAFLRFTVCTMLFLPWLCDFFCFHDRSNRSPSFSSAACWEIQGIKGKGKAIPLQPWTGPEGSRRMRLPDFKTISTWRW